MRSGAVIRIILIASLYALVHYTYSVFSLQGSLESMWEGWPSFLFILLLSNLAGAILYHLLRYVRKFRHEGRAGPVPFAVTGSLTLAAVLLITLLGGMLYRILFLPGIPFRELNVRYPGFMIQIAVISLFTGIVFAVTDHSLDSYRVLETLRLSTRKLQTEQVNLRLESLRTQISPHFLFNSLNTISSLIYRDLRKAEQFIRNLAAVYQGVLRNYEFQLVALSEEMELVKHYAYLMQVRFEDALNINTELPEEAGDLCVPPMSVQMLVENAVKHNHMSRENPLEIRIYSENGYLVVRNNYIGESGYVKLGNDLYKKPGQPQGTGIGLQNIRNRYRLLSDKPVLINKDEYFTVALPLIQAHEA